MNYPIAVFSPMIGVRSETFIRRHMQDLLPGRTAGITGHIISDGNGDAWNVEGPVLILRSAPRRALRKLGLPVAGFSSRALARFLERHRIRVLLGEYLDESLPLLSVAKEAGVRFFAHAHGYDVSRSLKDPRLASAYLNFNQSSGIITMSQASRSRLLGLGIDESKVHAVPYGVDVPDAAVLRPENKIVRCVAAGRMVPKKAPLLTLEAFRRANAACPNLRLDYIGTGEMLAAAKAFVRASGLDGAVTFHGAQSNEFVQKTMEQGDIFLQHSITDPSTGDEEGLPVAILEAMGKSLPVVATRHAGIPEAVLPGRTGCLGAEQDVEAMAEYTIALARDHALRLKMGIAGWQRAREHFTWDRERNELLRLFGLDGERNAS